jgi:hypothetical protein
LPLAGALHGQLAHQSQIAARGQSIVLARVPGFRREAGQGISRSSQSSLGRLTPLPNWHWPSRSFPGSTLTLWIGRSSASATTA